MFNERAGVFYELRVYWTVSKTFDVDLLILALIFRPVWGYFGRENWM